jgi:hypothetical protein
MVARGLFAALRAGDGEAGDGDSPSFLALRRRAAIDRILPRLYPIWSVFYGMHRAFYRKQGTFYPISSPFYRISRLFYRK